MFFAGAFLGSSERREALPKKVSRDIACHREGGERERHPSCLRVRSSLFIINLVNI